MNQHTCLTRASEAVDGDRQRDYGHPRVNHGRTARLWSAYLGIEITPTQVCVLNILQKISRLQNAYHHDGPTDIAGYARNIEMIEASVQS
jgi:hypothetical protein